MSRLHLSSQAVSPTIRYPTTRPSHEVPARREFPEGGDHLPRAAGHQVFDFRGTGDEGIDDSEVFQKAQGHAAILLSTDRDFFHTIPHRFDSHRGVVVIALRQPNRRAILARLEWILSQVEDHQFNNRVFQLRDSTWLAYPPIAD